MADFMTFRSLEAADNYYMGLALEQAKTAASEDEVPVGAVLVQAFDSAGAEGFGFKTVALTRNNREGASNPVGHAELLAIEEASKTLGRWRLIACTLYVTLEPCVMCAGAIVQARVDRVVYGAVDPKAGAVESLYQILSDGRLNHRPQVRRGVLSDECSLVLKEFFQQKRT